MHMGVETVFASQQRFDAVCLVASALDRGVCRANSWAKQSMRFKD